ncbi:unnamed protein product [Closterium sp. Yama58-4]|nr:unnamed protein product [Closterium sp. Yama58-4]
MMLAAAGYALVGVDYEGHGLSAGRHGYIRSFTQLADDVIEFANRLRAKPRFAHLPFFLYGESMGGAMAIQVARRDPTPWSGAVLVAPMCKMAQELIPPAPVIFVLKCLSYIFPTWKLVPVSANPDVCFQVPEKRERAENHPFAYQDKPRLATALQLLRTTQDIGAHMEEVTVPLLILHGAKDMVTDPAASQELFIRSSSSDKEIKIYEGCWHALTCGEPDDVIARVVGDIIAWLNARSLPPGSAPPGAAPPGGVVDGAVPPGVVEAGGGGEVGDAAADDEMSSTVTS